MRHLIKFESISTTKFRELDPNEDESALLRRYQLMKFTQDEKEQLGEWLNHTLAKKRWLHYNFENIGDVLLISYRRSGIRLNSFIWLYKHEDDWYYCNLATSNSLRRFLCDEWEGLMSFLDWVNKTIIVDLDNKT